MRMPAHAAASSSSHPAPAPLCEQVRAVAEGLTILHAAWVNVAEVRKVRRQGINRYLWEYNVVDNLSTGVHIGLLYLAVGFRALGADALPWEDVSCAWPRPLGTHAHAQARACTGVHAHALAHTHAYAAWLQCVDVDEGYGPPLANATGVDGGISWCVRNSVTVPEVVFTDLAVARRAPQRACVGSHEL